MLSFAHLDSLPPDKVDPPRIYGAADLAPVEEREKELCRQADHADYVYIVGLLALDAGAVFVDTQYFRFLPQPGLRPIGPSIAGLTWGATVGGVYLSFPKCDPRWTAQIPPEGDVRAQWPMALALAMGSALTAPFFARIEQGAIIQEWPVWERFLDTALPAVTGFAGALLPYLVPPRTWAARIEMEKLRLNVSDHGASVGIRFTF